MRSNVDSSGEERKPGSGIDYNAGVNVGGNTVKLHPSTVKLLNAGLARGYVYEPGSLQRRPEVTYGSMDPSAFKPSPLVNNPVPTYDDAPADRIDATRRRNRAGAEGPKQSMPRTYGWIPDSRITAYEMQILLDRGLYYLDPLTGTYQPTGDMIGEETRAAIGEEAIADQNLVDDNPRIPQEKGLVYGGADYSTTAREGRVNFPEGVPAPVSDEVANILYGSDEVARAELVTKMAPEGDAMAGFSGNWSDPEDRGRYLLENYPSLAVSAHMAGLTESEIGRVTNLTVAVDTAKKIVEAQSATQTKQILDSLPEQQRVLVASLAEHMAARMVVQQTERELAYQNKPAWIRVVQEYAGKGLEAGLNVLAYGNEQMLHGARTAWLTATDGGLPSDVSNVGMSLAMTPSTQIQTQGVNISDPSDFSAAWEATSHGSWNEERLQAAREKYGDWQVDVMVNVLDAVRSGDDDKYAAVLDVYSKDDAAMRLIINAMDDVSRDKELEGLVRTVFAARNDDLGSMVVGQFVDPTLTVGLGPIDVSPFETGRDVGNLTATVALDPLWITGGAGKAAKAARYGVKLMAGNDATAGKAGKHLAKRVSMANPATSRTGKLWQQFNGSKNVQRYFDWYGGQLERIRGLTGMDRTNAVSTLNSQAKKYMPPEALESALAAGVKDSRSAYEWMQGGENLALILNGQAAKRGNQVYIPHMSNAMRGLKAVSKGIRKADITKWTVLAADRELATAFGDDFAELTYDEQVEVFLEVLDSPQRAEELGTLIGDFGGGTTRIGKIVRKIAGDKEVTDRVWWNAYGHKKKRGGNLFENVRRAADRRARFFSRMPTYFEDGVEFSDGRDADKVYQAARWAGVPRYWAEFFRGSWVEMTEGQRRMAWVGLNRTFAKSVGADLIDPSGGVDAFLKDIVGLSDDQLYAPNSIDNLAGIRGTAARAADEAIPNLEAQNLAREQELARVTKANANRPQPTDEDIERALVEQFDQTTVEQAKFIDGLNTTRQEDVAKRVEMQQQIDQLERTEAPALGTPELQPYIDDVLETQYAEPEGYSTLGDVLRSGFHIDAAPARKRQALNMRKSKNGWVATNEQGTYRITRMDGGYAVTFQPNGAADDAVPELIAGVETKKAAFDAARMHDGRGIRTVGQGEGFTATELKMLDRGYLPARWARYWRDGGKDSSVWGEEEAARFYNVPDMANADWTGILETARRVEGGGKQLWIPIPWMHGRGGVIDQAERKFLEPVDQQLDNLGDEIYRVEASIQEVDAELGRLRDEGYISGMDGLRAQLDPDRVRLADGSKPEPLEAPPPPLTAIERERIIASKQRQLMDEAPVVNPSVTEGGTSHAVFVGQATTKGAMPNYAALDHLRARTSYAGALLMRNTVGRTVTDYWTFATLGGPRFALRNGLEDLVFYALTGGNIPRYFQGRRTSTAIREATERANNEVLAARGTLANAEKELETVLANRSTPEQIAAANEKVEQASKNLARVEAKRGGKGLQLGIIKTTNRVVGDKIGQHVPGMRQFIIPHLTREEVASASKLAADGDREALSQLVMKAYLRQRLAFMGNRDYSAIYAKLEKGASQSDLSAREQRILSDLDDFMLSEYGTHLMDEASETSRYLIDGTMPSHQVREGALRTEGGVTYRRVTFNPKYESRDVGEKVTQKQAEGIIAQLHFALDTDGARGQRAMTLLPRYYNALVKGDDEEAREVITILTEFVENSPNREMYDSLALQNETGLFGANKRVLDTLVNTFTTKEGRFNRELYSRLKIDRPPRPNNGQEEFDLFEELKTGVWKPFALEKPDGMGNMIPTLTTGSFANGSIPAPATTLVRSSDGVWVPADINEEKWWTAFRSKAWTTMGRSLARMTREPIFMSNYMDQRMMLRGLEETWVEQGMKPEMARRQAAKMASERALKLTMSYADNPAIRSQGAYAVRNVARFYRAQEDFMRRLVRTGSNNPSFFYKALIAWEATQNTGFVHTDDFGEEYFVYPGSQATNQTLMQALNLIGGINVLADGVPLVTSGKVQWLSPSADPESWWPTFSSPLTVFPKALLRAFPNTRWLEVELFGEISANKGLIEGTLPPNVTRAVSLTSAFINANANGVEGWTGTAGANAARRAALALMASGNYSENMTEQERLAFKRDVDIAAANIMVGQFILGFWLPSSPQLSPGEVNNFAREIGVTGFRPAFIAELQHAGEGADWEEVAMNYSVRNPGKAIFTISESEGIGRGRWQSYQDNFDYITDNKELIKTNARGASFFAPNTGIESLQTHTLLTAQGLKEKKDTLTLINALVEAEGDMQRKIAEHDYETLYLQELSDPEDPDFAMKRRALKAALSQQKYKINLEYNLINKDEESFANLVDHRNTWNDIVAASKAIVGENVMVDWFNESNLEVNTEWMIGEVDRLKYENDLKAAEKGRDDARAVWSIIIDPLWYSAIADDDDQQQNMLKAATFAIFGTTGGTWPWTNPEDDGSEEVVTNVTPQ